MNLSPRKYWRPLLAAIIAAAAMGAGMAILNFNIINEWRINRGFPLVYLLQAYRDNPHLFIVVRRAYAINLLFISAAVMAAGIIGWHWGNSRSSLVRIADRQAIDGGSHVNTLTYGASILFVLWLLCIFFLQNAGDCLACLGDYIYNSPFSRGPSWHLTESAFVIFEIIAVALLFFAGLAAHRILLGAQPCDHGRIAHRKFRAAQCLGTAAALMCLWLYGSLGFNLVGSHFYLHVNPHDVSMQYLHCLWFCGIQAASFLPALAIAAIVAAHSGLAKPHLAYACMVVVAYVTARQLIPTSWGFYNHPLPGGALCAWLTSLSLVALGLLILHLYLRFLRRGEAKAAAQAVASIQQASVSHGTDRLTMAEIDEEVGEVRKARQNTANRS